MKVLKLSVLMAAIAFMAAPASAQKSSAGEPQYKLLATRRTGTMQKEIDEISAQGYRILVGSPTSSTEMAVFLSREGTPESQYKYKLLATTLTSTLQKEVTEAQQAGYRIVGMVSRGEHMVVMERETDVRKL